MEKKVLAAADAAQRKYYFAPEFHALPKSIKEEIRAICILLAQKLGCTFLMGFYETGELYFETVRREDDFDFDEIGAGLEISALRRKKKELLASLELWYAVFFTEEGLQAKERAADSPTGRPHPRQTL